MARNEHPDPRIEARRRALAAALASNRLEGHEPDPAFADIHEARAAGRIDHRRAMHEVERRILGTVRAQMQQPGPP